MNITIDKLLEWDCCYDREKLEEIFGGRESFTPLEVSRKRSVSREDRIWVLFRTEVLGDNLPKVMQEIVDPRVRRYGLNCGIPEIEAWAEICLNGSDRSFQSADSTARSAFNAAHSAYLARSVARSAARSAFNAACSDGKDPDKARDEERKRQLRIIKRYLKKKEDD